MVLDRPLIFAASEVNFSSTGGAGHFSDGGGPVPANKGGGCSNPRDGFLPLRLNSASLYTTNSRISPLRYPARR